MFCCRVIFLVEVRLSSADPFFFFFFFFFFFLFPPTPPVGFGNYDGTPGPLVYNLRLHGKSVDVRKGPENVTLTVDFNVRAAGPGAGDRGFADDEESEHQQNEQDG
jgi:hypothetical protein